MSHLRKKHIRSDKMKVKRGRGPWGGPGRGRDDLQKDLQLMQSDPRFAHVASDPKFRHIPKKERKVKLDSRFHSILTDEKFYEKSTMDPRGRKGNYSTKEDLLRFYHLSSDEDSEEEEEEEKEEEEDDVDEDEDEDEEERDDEGVGGSGEGSKEDMYFSPDVKGKKAKGMKKGRIPEEKSEKSGKEETKKKKAKSISKGETTQEEEEEAEDESNKEEDTAKRDEEERSKVTPEVRSRLQDLTKDYARGGGDLFSSDSSDDDSTTTDEEDEEVEEFEWAELDQDAAWDNEVEVEETSRIAICNLDWDRIKAADLMVLFSSFCPRGSSVHSVAIYPSEYGKKRMAEEDRSGPQELTGRRKKGKGRENDEEEEEEEEEEEGHDGVLDLVDLDKLEKGKLDESVGATKRDFEALRRYQRNRLRYFYAVMECDTINTARSIYKECDRQPFEGAGILLDLRYIPSDMVFDETPHDLCRTVPQTYRAKSFVTTALQSTRPALTWDETNPDRSKALSTAMMQALKGGTLDDDQLRDFLASSSEEEDEEEKEEEEENSSDEEGNEEVKAARIAKFRALIQEIDEKEKRRKESEIDMEDMLEENEGEEKEEGEEEKKNEEENAQLNPFEKYLEKRKAKKKEKRMKQKERKMKGGTEESGETDDDAISDDELPEGIDDLYSDPFFAEELKKRKKKKIGKKKQTVDEEDEDDSNDKGNLELLLMEEEEEDKRHFSMREIIKSNEEDTRKKKRKKNLKKKMKEKQEEQKKKVDDFKVNISDPRFSELMTSGEYNIDPSHPQFKRTKAMDGLIGEIQRKRRVESGEEVLGAKRPHLEEETKKHLELTSLVQRVKRKTGKGKKTAKRNSNDT